MDTNDTTRQVVITGISQFGIAGKLTGGLTAVLWPANNNDIWDSLRGRIEALINQKIAEEDYHQVSLRLDGLRNKLTDYHTIVSNSQDNELRKNTWLQMEASFDEKEPLFMDAKYRLLLLPLFAQFANLYLALLREGWSNLETWGLDASLVTLKKQKLKDTIQRYGTYANDTFHAHLAPWERKRSKWNERNQYFRGMTLDVLDHAHYWPFFDPSNPEAHSVPTRIIYSDPAGGDALDDIFFDENATPIPLTGLSAYGDSSMWGFRVEYAGGAMQETPHWREGDPQGMKLAEYSARWPAMVTDGVYGRTTDYIQKPGGKWDEWKNRSGITVFGAIVNGGDFPMFVARSDDMVFRYSTNSDFRFTYPGHVLASAHCIPGREGTFIFGFRLRSAYP
jgi:hypothetical protein